MHRPLSNRYSRILCERVSKDTNGHPVFRAEQTKVTIQDVIAAEGSRSPDIDHSQRKFNTGIVVLVAHGQSPSHELIERANGIRQQWIEYWQTTTGRRASMTATNADRPPLGGEPVLNNVDCRIALQFAGGRLLGNWEPSGSLVRNHGYKIPQLPLLRSSLGGKNFRFCDCPLGTQSHANLIRLSGLRKATTFCHRIALHSPFTYE